MLREKSTVKMKYSFEDATKILAGMEVDRATHIKAVTFLYEPKRFTALVVMNEKQRKYWLGTLKDQ